MKIALLISGGLAALALASPQLVVAGFFLGIVPGLILAVAPTVFVYLAASALIRRALPPSFGIFGYVAAIVIALAVGWACMLPFRAAQVARYEAALLPDIATGQPLVLRGHVRLEVPPRPAARSTPVACDHLCAALLDLPGVHRVTRVRGKEAVSYALVTAAEHPEPGQFPEEPGRLLPKPRAGSGYRDNAPARRAMEAWWALRLATKERLVADPSAAGSPADWILRETRERERGEPAVFRIEIFDAGGVCRFRQSHVRYEVPARAFYVGFQSGSAGSGFSSARFEVGRQPLQSGSVVLESEAEPTLLEAIGLEVSAPPEGAVDDLRAEVAAALKDRQASAARLTLANRWLALGGSVRDQELIAAIVADPRMREVAEPLSAAIRKDDPPLALREALAKRILMDHTPERDRHALAERLAAMPPGAFARPAPAHLAIWSDPEMRRQAAPFAARVADLGGERATPLLLAWLQAATSLEPWNRRRSLIEAIREGFVKLGTQASAAVPGVRELMVRRPSPVMRTSSDFDDWCFALARMGLSLDDLPFFPDWKQPQIARTKNRVRTQLDKYESAARATKAGSTQ